jgi:hypothetical protein
MVAHPVDEDVAMSGDAYVSPDRWAAYACGCTARPQRAGVGSVED